MRTRFLTWLMSWRTDVTESKVKWHPYPDEKPESYTKEYLLTVETHYSKHRDFREEHGDKIYWSLFVKP